MAASSNFAFLQEHDPVFLQLASTAEQVFASDPTTTLSVMRPILANVADGTPLALSELRERIANEFQLSEEERSEHLPSSKQTMINNRVGWAHTYLNKAGLLSIPAKGMVQITEHGREALNNGPARITVSWFKQYREFAVFHATRPGESTVFASQSEPLEQATPDEQLAVVHQALTHSLTDDLLALARAASPLRISPAVLARRQWAWM